MGEDPAQDIGRKYDATLWRNHPGADDDTQYVWWHCSNAPPANCDNLVNFNGFNDEVINKAFETARASTDINVRRQSYEAINRHDLPTIQGTTLFLALGVCMASLIVDILYAFLDPRVRYD